MQNILKTRTGRASFYILATVFCFSSIFLVFHAVLAVTTITNNQAAAQKVTASESDFLVLDFNINVDNETTLAGTAPSAGTTITATKPEGWTTTKFYDASAGGAWSAGSDWLGNSESNYYQIASTIIACPDGNEPAVWYTSRAMCEDGPKGVPSGSSGWWGDAGGMSYVTTGDYLCYSGSITNPTVLYKANSSSCLVLADGRCTAGNEWKCYIRGSFPSGGANITTELAQANGIVYWDGNNNGSFTMDEDSLFVLPNQYNSGSYFPSIFYESSETLAGTPPAALSFYDGRWRVTPVVDSKPVDWTSLKMYDDVGGGEWSDEDDWVGLDVNGDNVYLDILNTITTDLHEDAMISSSNVSNVKFYAGNPGSGALLGTATSYDGGGSGWYLDGISRGLNAGANRFYITMSVSGASDGDRIRMKVPREDANSDNDFDLGDTGVFVASRLLGNFANTSYMTVDDIDPTLTITMDDNEFLIGDSTTVTFEFSEEVTGFTLGADASADNGVLSNLNTEDDITFTATYTPSADVAYDNVNYIIVNMTGVYDIAGNTGVGNTSSENYEVDTERPTLVITMDDSGLLIGETADVTFTFSEEVTGFVLADDAVADNGTLSELTTEDNIVYHADFDPTADIDYDSSNNITVTMSGVTDVNIEGGNDGAGTEDSPNYNVDTTRPTLDISIDDSGLIIDDTAEVTFTFSEEVAGFVLADDAEAENGTLSGLSSADNIIYTATLTPDSDVDYDTSNIITVNLSGVADVNIAPGNSGDGNEESSVYEVDTTRPTLVITMDDSGLIIDDTAEVTFTFSEEVNDFVLADDATAENATLSSLSTEDNIVFTAILTPDSDVDYDTSNVVTVDLSGVKDVNIEPGNDGSGNEDSENFEVDTTRPTLVITLDDNALIIGETADVTFTFSEEVAGFVLADDTTVQNGTLSDLSTEDNVVYHANLDPDADVDYDDTNLITVAMNGVVDVNIEPGNTGGDDWDSPNYEVDTTRPTLTIEIDDTSLIIEDTAEVTFTFSEAVSGFTLDDATSDNGTLSDLATIDNTIFTATLTPDADTEVDENIVSVDLSGVSDVNIAPGNPGEETEDSPNYLVDTIVPGFTMQYYTNSGLTNAVSDNGYLKAGTYYIKLTSHEPLDAVPTVTLIAEGSANDVTDGESVGVSGNIYKYTRVITYDADAVGTTLENISITATDDNGNTSTNVNPTNEESKSIYTDTVNPAVNAGTDKGTVSSTFTQIGSATDVGGSGVSTYAWSKDSGYYEITFGSPTDGTSTVNVDGGGPYTIKLTATDVAGNSASDTATFTWGVIPTANHGGGAGGSGGFSQCHDGYDNDNDGLIDLNDPGCTNWDDNSEYNAPVVVVPEPPVAVEQPTTSEETPKLLETPSSEIGKSYTGGYQYGDLIRVPEFSAVYFVGAGGVRHPFMDEASYLTYFKDFSSVHVTDLDVLGEYPMGSPIPYAEGSLIKLRSIPKVFLVEAPNIIRWITTEAIFLSHGYKFSDVHDVSEAFWSAYQVGENITE